MGAMRTAYGEALVELGASNGSVVVLGADTTDSMKSGMFGQKYPERFFNLGIAEQNLVGVAAGLAFGGKVAFAGTYAIFVPGKCVDQIRNMLCYADLNVKLVCSHAGITVGPDGGSHEQVEDLALMRAIPHMRVLVPADAPSVKAMVQAIAEIPGPFYMRITRGVVKGSSTPVVYENGLDYKLGRANVVMDGGGDIALFACGIMVPEAMKAAESLGKKGVKASVIDVHTVKPVDQETVVKYAKACGAAVSAEEHNVIGGMGSAVSEVLTDQYPIPLKRVGVMDTFGESGEAQELLNKYGLTAARIEEAAQQAIAMKRR